jgi:hypothetical protein
MRTRAGVLWRSLGVRIVLAVVVLVTLACDAYTAAQHVADSLTVTVRTRVVSCSGPPSCLQQTELLFR